MSQGMRGSRPQACSSHVEATTAAPRCPGPKHIADAKRLGPPQQERVNYAGWGAPIPFGLLGGKLENSLSFVCYNSKTGSRFR